MSVPFSHRKSGPYTAVQGQTDFTFNFRVLSADDLIVMRRQGAVKTELTHALAWSILPGGLNNPAGGTVRLVTPLNAGDQLLIDGDRQQERLTDLTDQFALNASRLNTDYDNLQVQIQEARRDLARSLGFDELMAVYDAKSRRLGGVAAAVDDTDVPNFLQVKALAAGRTDAMD